jgi:hypothetical protein
MLSLSSILSHALSHALSHILSLVHSSFIHTLPPSLSPLLSTAQPPTDARGYPLSIKLEGQEEGDPQQGLMDVYELEEGKEVNARGVWKATGKEAFMYYASNNQWFIGTRENMEAGKAVGWMYVSSTALTPDKITETWLVGDGKAWVDGPKVRARVYTAEEARAEAERLEQEQAEAARKERGAVQQQQQEGRVVFRRIRGAIGDLDAAADYTVAFDKFSTIAPPQAKASVGSKIFYEFEVLKLAPNSCPQAGFASDRFDLTIEGHSNSGVGDDTYRCVITALS